MEITIDIANSELVDRARKAGFTEEEIKEEAKAIMEFYMMDIDYDEEHISDALENMLNYRKVKENE